MPSYSYTQVREHNHSASCWVVYKGKVYDVTDFIHDHPGGHDILMPFAGEDITDVLSDESVHMHSDAAYELLDEYYYIGDLMNATASPTPATTPALSVSDSGNSDDELLTEDAAVTAAADLGHRTLDCDKKRKKKTMSLLQPQRPSTKSDETFLDLRKPLFPQLWNATYSKSFYLEQVHRPRFVPYYVPYFANPWMDVLSRTQWFMVPIVWLPFVGYQLWRSTHADGHSIVDTSQFFGLGVLFWTLLEYCLHRFLFHLDDLVPDNRLALLVHFTLHGIHHHMPMDRLRLVMPPALTVLIGLPIVQATHQLMRPTWAHAFVAGAFFGYVCYDCIHYYLHHAQVMKVHFREMKRYHLAHHYKNYESGYGITSKIWDYVFNTVLIT
ncbi:hypothetical protein BX666DRAFT_1949432 [Dichotomocladium elegans]|nr:hypothetical protein BX666DRAFT_1949432 [Dichotomocladium elegans]